MGQAAERMRRFVFIFLAASGSAARSADIPPPVGETIVDPDARFEILFTRSAPIRGGLTEGPAAAPDGTIFFSDIPNGEDPGMILKFDPKTGKTTVFVEDSRKSNGLLFDREGRLWACEGASFGGRCLARYNASTGERVVVVDRFEGKAFNSPNDLCIDREGRIYFTDPRYVGDEPRDLEHQAVYLLDSDGKLDEFTHEVRKPNGIAVSRDGKWLYVAEHDNEGAKSGGNTPAAQGDMRIYAFPLARNGRRAGARRTVWDFRRGKGCDGMTVDPQGNLYLTVRDPASPGVLVLASTGKQLAFLPTGPKDQKVTAEQPAVGLPSNVEFGRGEESDRLYVTVDTSLYRIRLKVPGR